ncbi:hypothetical protein C8R43DRAFT_947408 [Mycena crocata]|nr:hypothetical protein C8R43DRAFT_947408 [Mycena crocata]
MHCSNVLVKLVVKPGRDAVETRVLVISAYATVVPSVSPVHLNGPLVSRPRVKPPPHLIWDSDIDVVEEAIYALCRIADDAKGSEAILNARALDCVPDLLESPNAEPTSLGCSIYFSRLNSGMLRVSLGLSPNSGGVRSGSAVVNESPGQ